MIKSLRVALVEWALVAVVIVPLAILFLEKFWNDAKTRDELLNDAGYLTTADSGYTNGIVISDTFYEYKYDNIYLDNKQCSNAIIHMGSGDHTNLYRIKDGLIIPKEELTDED